MASMSINGVVSGMDWESMIDEIITAAAKPAQVQVNKKTNLQNKKSLFEEMKVMMNSLQSSLTTLKLPSTYKAKEIEIENLDGGSYKKILTATVNADAEVSVHDIEVKQIATAQTLRSRQMTGSTISSYVGGKDKVMSITAGGQTVDVEVKASDSLQSLKSRINNAIKSLDNPMNLTASVVDNKLVLKSDSTGLGQTKIEGTVRGGYSSSGVNSLKGLITNADSGATADISVTSDNYDNLKITSNGKEYKRGTDYEIINGNEIRWKQYEDTDNEIKLGKSVSDMKYTLNSKDVYSVKGTSGETEADLSALNFIDNGTLSSRVKIIDDNGVEYTYGQDFTIEDGKVVWLASSTETTPTTPTTVVSAPSTIKASYKFSDSTFTTMNVTTGMLNTATMYTKLTGAPSLSDLGLNDSAATITNGGYTYVNKEYGKIAFSVDLTRSDGEAYEYGRDYAVRIQDSTIAVVYPGNSSWPFESASSTGARTTKPDTAYNFTYNNSITTDSTSFTDGMSASDILGFTPLNYDNLTLTDENGTEYTAGTDYEIDSSGNINWLTTTTSEAPTSYTVKYTAEQVDLTPDTGKNNYDSLLSGTAFPNIDGITSYGFETEDITISNKVVRTIDIYDPSSTKDYKFFISLKDSEGNYSVSDDYVYGRDFTIRKSDDASNSSKSLLVAFYRRDEVTNYGNYVTSHPEIYGQVDLSGTKHYRPDSDYRVSLVRTEKSSDVSGISSLISNASGNYGKIEVIGSNGKTYTYVASEDDLTEDNFTIIDGAIKFKTAESAVTPGKAPDEGVGYTLTYEAFDDLTGSSAYSGASQQDINITVDEGFGNIGGDKLSYEQILSNTGLTSSSSNSDFAKYFSLTDGTTTYTYGTDYTIIQSTTTDSTTGEHAVAIKWLDDGTKPANNATVTLTYTDSETMDLTDAVTRSAQDTITSTSTVMPTYGTFIDADAIRITDGKNSYYLGQDFTIDIDAYSYRNGSVLVDENNNFIGNAVIKWNTTSLGEPDYTSRFEDASSVVITASDGTTYTEDEDFMVMTDGQGHAVIDWINSEPDNTSLTYTVTVEKDGTKKTYDLNSDLSTMTQRAAWLENEASDTYDIIVTKNGVNTTFTGNRSNDELEILPSGLPDYSDFESGTVTITQGQKTFYDGVDFTIEKDDDGNAVVQWITDAKGGYEWYYPNPGQNSTYTINLTSSDGTTKTYTGTRSYKETLDMADYGFTTYNGNISVKTTDNDGNEVYVDASSTQAATDSSGNVIYQQERKSRQVPDLDEDGDYQFDSSGNILYKTEYYYENKLDENGNPIPVMVSTGNNALADAYSFNVTTGTTGGSNTLFNFNWLTPSRTARKDLPAYGDELNITYEYDANTFTLSGTDDVLDDLGLDSSYWYNSDGSENNAYYTGAHNAIFDLDGTEVERDTNDIGESYGNEIANLKGVTLHLKGPGSVSLDISQDAEKAVESINTFVDSYNDLMTWMNTRMTESQVDEDTAATVDSDDFRMRWGLLHGNSLLRNTKSQMRNLISQNFSYSFTQRTSSEEIYGTMANNGLRADATLRLRIGSVYSDLTISPYYTLQEIVDMINDSTNPAMRNMYYDSDGNLLDQPLLKAAIVDDKLQITSTSDEAISVSGTSALNALKMNYTYKGIYQLGIGINATADMSAAGNSGYTADLTKAKSGEIEFDESKFMDALEDNPDEVQELMLMFVGQMDSWCKSMLTSSGDTSGTLTRQIEDIDTQIASIDEYLEKYQDRLDRQEESLRSKFTAAESQIAKLSQQANSIASILNMLNGNSSGSSSYTAQT